MSTLCLQQEEMITEKVLSSFAWQKSKRIQKKIFCSECFRESGGKFRLLHLESGTKS